MRNRIKRNLLAKMGPKDLDRKSIKEEYVEPDFVESPLNVKRKPIKIKTERVAIKEGEEAMHELDDHLVKKEVSDSIKDEYVEYEIQSTSNVKAESSFLSTEKNDDEVSIQNEGDISKAQFGAQSCNEFESPVQGSSTSSKSTCEHCEREFDDASGLEKHLSNHHNTKHHKCSLCDEEFRKEAALDYHIQEKHQEDLSKCDNCTQMFINHADLQSHIERAHTEKPEKLKVKVKDATPLFTKMMLLPWKCKDCGQELKSEKLLKKHIHVVHEGGVDELKCKSCDFVGKTSSQLKLHMLRKHPELEPARFKCKYCAYTCPEPSVLKTHLLYHVKFAYKCGYCPETSFTKKADHKFHMLKHGEPYSCTKQLCSKSFASQKNLSEHLLTHDEDFERKCDQCEKSFKIFAHLKRHILKVHKQVSADATGVVNWEEGGDKLNIELVGVVGKNQGFGTVLDNV